MCQHGLVVEAGRHSLSQRIDCLDQGVGQRRVSLESLDRVGLLEQLGFVEHVLNDEHGHSDQRQELVRYEAVPFVRHIVLSAALGRQSSAPVVDQLVEHVMNDTFGCAAAAVVVAVEAEERVGQVEKPRRVEHHSDLDARSNDDSLELGLESIGVQEDADAAGTNARQSDRLGVAQAMLGGQCVDHVAEDATAHEVNAVVVRCCCVRCSSLVADPQVA